MSPPTNPVRFTLPPNTGAGTADCGPPQPLFLHFIQQISPFDPVTTAEFLPVSNTSGTRGRASMQVTRISAAGGVIVQTIRRIRHRPSLATISSSDPVRAATRLQLGAGARDRQREGVDGDGLWTHRTRSQALAKPHGTRFGFARRPQPFIVSSHPNENHAFPELAAASLDVGLFSMQPDCRVMASGFSRVEHSVQDRNVAGSNPVAPTHENTRHYGFASICSD
jgi:hypothetical protein